MMPVNRPVANDRVNQLACRNAANDVIKLMKWTLILGPGVKLENGRSV